jgi:hypothetical protein
VIYEIPQRLDPARRCTGTDRYQTSAFLSQSQQSQSVLLGRDRSFDDRDIIRSSIESTARLCEMSQIYGVSNGEQFILGVEQCKLATIARSELHDCDFRLGFHHRSLTRILLKAESHRTTGPSLQRKSEPHWQ